MVHGDEVAKGKPDPEMFLMAAAKLQVPPEDCLVIEDAVTGIQVRASPAIHGNDVSSQTARPRIMRSCPACCALRCATAEAAASQS